MGMTQNTQRVSARITPKVYEKLVQAAEITGATLNQFIVQSASEKAQEVIENEHFIKLTTRSAQVFFQAMEHPPEPNEKLKNGVRRYASQEIPVEN